jgi:hypothetical protein
MPEIGRFISADTIVPDPPNPQNFNRYAYALNSPLNYIDPTGHSIQPPCPQCRLEIYISGWSELATDLAAGICLLAGCHVDREREVIAGPTVEEGLANGITDIANPIRMAAGPTSRVAKTVMTEAAETAGEQLTRPQVIQALEERVQPLDSYLLSILDSARDHLPNPLEFAEAQ